MADLWGFLVLAVVLSVTPGPDDVLVLRSALRGGPRPWPDRHRRTTRCAWPAPVTWSSSGALR